MGQPPAWPGAYPRQPLGMAPAYAPQNSYPAASQPLSPGWSRPSAPVAAAPVPAPQPARSGSAGFVARGAMPEAPATASFKLPAPEALGIHPATPAPTVMVSADAFDWTSARQQMTPVCVQRYWQRWQAAADRRHRCGGRRCCSAGLAARGIVAAGALIISAHRFTLIAPALAGVFFCGGACQTGGNFVYF